MTFDDLDPKMELKFENILKSKLKKTKLDDGFNQNKVVNQVLDKNTVLTLYNLLKKKTLTSINGVVKAGKESLVFWAKDDQFNEVALKIFLVTTSNFKKRAQYVFGDPRFSDKKKGTRNLIYLWAEKEFKNLTQCIQKGIPVVNPRFVSNNVLAMDFFGKNGVPDETLLETEVDYHDYESAIEVLKKLYHQAGLVHGDFSEFNVFKSHNRLVVFDLGSAVDKSHPMAMDFLKRDIKNISKFFAKRGLTIPNPDDVFRKLIS